MSHEYPPVRVLQPDPQTGAGSTLSGRIGCGLNTAGSGRVRFSYRNISGFCRVTLFHYLSVSYHLAITGNSAASERLFSETRRLVEARHQQLLLDSLDCIIILRKFWFFCKFNRNSISRVRSGRVWIKLGSDRIGSGSGWISSDWVELGLK